MCLTRRSNAALNKQWSVASTFATKTPSGRHNFFKKTFFCVYNTRYMLKSFKEELTESGKIYGAAKNQNLKFRF